MWAGVKVWPPVQIKLDDLIRRKLMEKWHSHHSPYSPEDDVGSAPVLCTSCALCCLSVLNGTEYFGTNGKMNIPNADSASSRCRGV